jgi:hypothetical protein
MEDTPSHRSRGLVNLIAEIESRMIGTAPASGLDPAIGDLIPPGQTYVLVVFDGLGVAQLGHEAARSFLASHQATLHAPFPTTTSVSLATIATGLPPSQHGLVSHLVWLQEQQRVVNTLKWVDLAGRAVDHDYRSVLPEGNLWERLRRAGVEPITVQPASFEGSPLSRVLYRGARFEGTGDHHELVEATVQLAATPGRFIFTYFWPIDFAGHVSGLSSEEFANALSLGAGVWEGLAARVPPGVTLIGTSDHGLIEYGEEDKILIRQARFGSVRFAGDPRGLQLWGNEGLMQELADITGGELVEPLGLLGPAPTATTRERVGDSLLLAPDGKVILPPGFDKRLRSYHGGMAPGERDIPLLVG